MSVLLVFRIRDRDLYVTLMTCHIYMAYIATHMNTWYSSDIDMDQTGIVIYEKISMFVTADDKMMWILV